MTIILTMLMAMVPVVELQGALPYGIAMGLSPFAATIAAIVGNMIPVPFIIKITDDSTSDKNRKYIPFWA